MSMFGITMMGAQNCFEFNKGIYENFEEEYDRVESKNQTIPQSQNQSEKKKQFFKYAKPSSDTKAPVANQDQPFAITSKYISPLSRNASQFEKTKLIVKEPSPDKTVSLGNTVEMTSFNYLKEMKEKHVRYNLEPTEKFKYPITSYQEIGWLSSVRNIPSTSTFKDPGKMHFANMFHNMSNIEREKNNSQRDGRKQHFPCSHTDIVQYRNNMILNNHL
ncbi:hypothetical protein FDP41_009284 [Naegleria fowleri]|uniref:Uncharacterized protein n=1 Tax=Naegleria fowleri TaxID=5763 RepID=A0A6A5BCH8_NAEFO|nr:uncharacterized protein FDP41_009284 [Naegleria fowleri]KAF0972381.1 hypothetical protein FDP41_009284 [Naegleria fowleri]CAG4716498.1 unnamed protein product [Naegleria fowleri]